MDDLCACLDNLKISAFKKVALITQQAEARANNTRTLTPKRIRSPATPRKPRTPKNLEVPYKKVLSELQAEKQKRVQQVFMERVRHFEAFSERLAQDRMRKWQEKQMELINFAAQTDEAIQQVLKQQDAKEDAQSQKLLLHCKNQEEKNLKNAAFLKAKQQKHKDLKEHVSKIKSDQEEFVKIYRGLLPLVNSGKEEVKNYFRSIKALQQWHMSILEKCKSFNVTSIDVLKSENILEEFRALNKELLELVTKKPVPKEEKAPVTPPVVPTSKPPVANQENVNTLNVNKTESVPKTPAPIEKFVRPASLKNYVAVMGFLEKHVRSFQALNEDNAQKPFRNNCKKAVNIPVNAITGVSPQHLQDKYDKLSKLLSGKTITIANVQINASAHPQGVAYCMDLLAKKFVLQGDLLISSNPEAAFSYATIIASLWHDFPDFGTLLLAYFYKSCPYLVPFYIPKAPDHTDEEFYTSQGYQYIDGQIEQQDKFLKRMTGISKLYFAILIAAPKRGLKNPYGLTHGWTWLASVLKLGPRLDITATVLYTFFETAGHEMEKVYGKRFIQLVRMVVKNFLPLMKAKGLGGPVTRLEVLFRDLTEKMGRFQPPEGVLPVNFW